MTQQKATQVAANPAEAPIGRIADGRRIHIKPQVALETLQRMTLMAGSFFAPPFYVEATTDSGSAVKLCIMRSSVDKKLGNLFALTGYVVEERAASDTEELSPYLAAMRDGLSFSGRYSLETGQPA